MTIPLYVNANQDEERPLLTDQHSRYAPGSENRRAKRLSIVTNEGEVRRGKIFMIFGVMSITFTWILFLGTAWFRLGTKGGGGK